VGHHSNCGPPHNFPFLRSDFEILAFLKALGFSEDKKKPDKLWLFLFFFRGKGLTLTKHGLSCIFITNLF